MPDPSPITCLLFDVGGVLLTDGWNHHSRRRAAEQFGLDWEAYEHRHQMNVAVYEEGKLSLDDYLARTVFNEERAFTRDEFWGFMKSQSQPFQEMLDFARRLKARHGLRVAVVSNEAREINEYRVRTFGLDTLVDSFVSSAFGGMRKPDVGLFRLALDVALTPVERVVYIENTALFVEIAAGLGVRGIVHADYESTRAQLADLGLKDD